MAALSRRKWCSAALVLAIGANATQLLAKHHAGLGMRTAARAAAEPAEWPRLRQSAFWHARRSDIWGGISLGLALLAVVCWALAHRYRESGPQSVLLALLSIYLLLLLLVV